MTPPVTIATGPGAVPGNERHVRTYTVGPFTVTCELVPHGPDGVLVPTWDCTCGYGQESCKSCEHIDLIAGDQ